MNSDRHSKTSGIIAELAATFIQKEANSDPLITVTRVDLAPDMRRAIIFVTTIPDSKEAEALVFLKRSSSEFRSYLKKHAKLRYIPHIEFMLDAGERHRQHMDELVREIHERD
jgi:ribosome-binding factor A